MGLVRWLDISKTDLCVYLDSVQYVTRVLTLWYNCYVNDQSVTTVLTVWYNWCIND